MVIYVEHIAYKVKDLDWCVKFFTGVFNMPIRPSPGEKPNRKIQLHVGIQLSEDITFDEEEDRLDHIILMTTDYDNVYEKCLAWGYTVLPTGDN